MQKQTKTSLLNRFLFPLIFITLCLMPSYPAYADVVFLPENNFFKEYVDQIINLKRWFKANGEDGNVIITTEPGSKNEITRIDNGDVIPLEYSCLYGGIYWGYSSDHEGWLQLNQMLVLYDDVSFAEDYGNQFYDYNGSYDYDHEDEEVYVWPWPGADEPSWSFSPNSTPLEIADYIDPIAYKDEEGREWGYIHYYFAHDSATVWICLSDPSNPDLPVLKPEPEPREWIADTVHTDIKQPEERTMYITLAIIGSLTVALAAGTAVLIKVLGGRDKKGKEGNDA